VKSVLCYNMIDIGIVALFIMFGGISLILTVFWVLLTYDNQANQKDMVLDDYGEEDRDGDSEAEEADDVELEERQSSGDSKNDEDDEEEQDKSSEASASSSEQNDDP